MPDHHRPRFRRRGALAAASSIVLSGLGLAASDAWAGGATPAASACAPREVLLRRLAEGYGEAPRALGLTGDGALLELLVSPGGRSFSILMTRPPSAGARGRVSCLVAAGEAWRPAPSAAERGRES